MLARLSLPLTLLCWHLSCVSLQDYPALPLACEGPMKCLVVPGFQSEQNEIAEVRE